MSEFVCNFAVARFRPYRETGEFVNVGVVLLCPQLDFFGHTFQHRKSKRITDFFPELELDIFKAGLNGLLKELNRVTSRKERADQLILKEEQHARIAMFKELVRPREALFHFGEIGTVLAPDPMEKLQQLFNFYVERQFAHDREYQEVIMRRRLAAYLHEVKLDHFYRQDFRVGDEVYNVAIPFVHLEGGTPRKAIKPLHLDKAAPTEIYRHGDAWISAVRRLRSINKLPKDFLFTIKSPSLGIKHQSAAQEICTELEKLDTRTVSFGDTDQILKFAQC